MVTVPRPPPTPERAREYDRMHAIGQALHGARVGQPTELEQPLKFPRHMTVWLSQGERWKKPKNRKTGERPEGYDLHNTYREPNGRFARKPQPGERAKRLRLPGTVRP